MNENDQQTELVTVSRVNSERPMSIDLIIKYESFFRPRKEHACPNVSYVPRVIILVIWQNDDFLSLYLF